MTAEGYDYEYGHSMFVFDDAYYGTRSSTTTTYHTVDMQIMSRG